VCVAMVLTKSQNETHGFIALSLEGNSGIDNGDLANPFVFLADPMFLGKASAGDCAARCKLDKFHLQLCGRLGAKAAWQGITRWRRLRPETAAFSLVIAVLVKGAHIVRFKTG